MNGFLGCVEADPAPGTAVRKWMADWLSTPPEKSSFEVKAAPFFYMASGESDPENRPAASDDAGLTVVYYGFIARDQLAESGSPEPKTNAEVAASLLRLYQAKGPEALAALNGRYVACVWNARNRSLELMDDIMGLKPIFLWQFNGDFCFASNAWALFCHPRFRKTINPLGLVDLLMFNHQQAQRTLFADLSVLPPGAVTTFQNGNPFSREEQA